MQQDVEKVSQLRSRIPQRLNVRENVRFTSSVAAALLEDLLNILRDVLIRVGQQRRTSSPTPTCRLWAALSSWRKISKFPLLLINAEGL